MQTNISNQSPIQENIGCATKTLMYNGQPTMESYSWHQQKQGSFFLEESKLLFVLEGVFKIRHGNTEYILMKNQMAFLKKDMFIEYLACPDDAGTAAKPRCLLVSLRYELVKEFTRMAELPLVGREEYQPITISTPGTNLLKYVDSLEPFFMESGKIAGSLIRIKLLELLFYLTGNNNNIIEHVLDVKEHFRSNITSTVEDNILNSLSLSQLAVLSGRSLSSFRRDFLAIYNMPPSQWIRKKRLEKARELLLSTTMSITDICYTLGFENIAHFSRLFKTNFGYPPSGFRLNTVPDLQMAN